MGTQRRQLWERHALVAPRQRALRASLETLELPKRAVEANQATCPCAAVQVVNVLRNETETVVL
jgi:hypothetical protein